MNPKATLEMKPDLSSTSPGAATVAPCPTDSKENATEMDALNDNSSTHTFQPKAEYDDMSLQGGAAADTARIHREECELPRTATQVDFMLKPMDQVPLEGNILEHDVRLLHMAHHGDPFSVLGPHSFPYNEERCVVIRAWIKDARTVEVRMIPGTNCSLEEGDDEGWVMLTQRCDWLFQRAFCWKPVRDALIPEGKTKNNTDLLAITKLMYEYRVVYNGDEHQMKYIIKDTYSFDVLLPQTDLELFQSGSCWHVDNLMGSHQITICGITGVRFAVWAPNAAFVSVAADFNQWDGRAHPMRKRHDFGVWELFVPTVAEPGQKYGYRIHSADGKDFFKIDPYAQEFENPPDHASIISGCDDAYKPTGKRYQWNDAEWMDQRAKNASEIRRKPMSIYEVHLPSWMRGEGNTYLTYREMAHRLVEHLKIMNFTHVEFLPLAHHPFEGSWGYQVSGLYAPYSRLGNPDDLKYLVDQLHQAGFGVFVDFVPAHFVKDDWGLVYYDGQPCFEYADPREGELRQWGTMVFNFRRNEVRSFLLGAAYHWLRRYHIDGLRIDAVSSMLYKNYCRDDGDWLPNEFGGDANLEAINMLQELNWVIHREFPGVFTMAEEATSWKGVTDAKGGLGFDAKWDLGWMNDTLSYLCTPTPVRHTKHNKLTFRGLYVAHEKWVLPLSHDEVVSGKGSLLDKCGFAGAPFQERISTLKALMTYQIGLAGRPLLFMGSEFGQGREWNENRSLDWHESKEDLRSKAMLYVADLLQAYKDEPALHAGDDEPWNFKWTECNNADSCTVAWLRNWMEWYNDILVIVNFSGSKKYRFPVGVPHGGRWKVLLNSDDWKYGGAMGGPGNGCEIQTTEGGRLGWPYCVWTDVAPFSALVLKAPQPTTEQLEKELKKNEQVPTKKEDKEEKTSASSVNISHEAVGVREEENENKAIENNKKMVDEVEETRVPLTNAHPKAEQCQKEAKEKDES